VHKSQKDGIIPQAMALKAKVKGKGKEK